ncbi:hypothetical protein BDF20DRAFT_795928, partial [Mycotypha africana]|uniref:uncharacterized protein n=1 Tax=Mycotypha africana TaxID=64632 RepID=UPI0022FFE73E
SALAYELHYEVMHRNVCSVCQKIFPNAYWLSLHIDEFHNILVQMKKERGEKTYKCLVEGCKYVGARPRNRNEHLRKQHSFPDYFPFQI